MSSKYLTSRKETRDKTKELHTQRHSFLVSWVFSEFFLQNYTFCLSWSQSPSPHWRLHGKSWIRHWVCSTYCNTKRPEICKSLPYCGWHLSVHRADLHVSYGISRLIGCKTIQPITYEWLRLALARTWTQTRSNWFAAVFGGSLIQTETQEKWLVRDTSCIGFVWWKAMFFV